MDRPRSFFVFTDYCRPSIRLSAIMHLPVLYVFTHDSIGVGEDGPTHQPIEHLMSLRAMPNAIMFRPCDANEVAEAYRVAMRSKHGPIILALTRQGVPTYERNEDAARGGYVLLEAEGGPAQVVLIGTGAWLAFFVALRRSTERRR